MVMLISQNLISIAHPYSTYVIQLEMQSVYLKVLLYFNFPLYY